MFYIKEFIYKDHNKASTIYYLNETIYISYIIKNISYFLVTKFENNVLCYYKIKHIYIMKHNYTV